MNESQPELAHILEAAIFAAGEPLSVEKLGQLFDESARPSNKDIRDTLKAMAEELSDRGIELIEVASGYRFQAKTEFAPWLKRLWEKSHRVIRAHYLKP